MEVHNSSKYDYRFIIKELAEEFRGEECSVPIKKEHDNDSGETITYKITFIDSCGFMPSKLSNLVDNLSEINNKDCKTCIQRKNIKSECKFIGVKYNRLNYRCKECNGTSAMSINDLIEKFSSFISFAMVILINVCC